MTGDWISVPESEEREGGGKGRKYQRKMAESNFTVGWIEFDLKSEGMGNGGRNGRNRRRGKEKYKNKWVEKSDKTTAAALEFV